MQLSGLILFYPLCGVSGCARECQLLASSCMKIDDEIVLDQVRQAVSLSQMPNDSAFEVFESRLSI